jgi:protein-disulfide isomerase
MIIRRRTLAFAILLASLSSLLTLAQALKPVPVTQTYNTIGSLDAPVSIVIYTDLECPYSAATFPVVQQLVESDPAHIHLTVRQFPLSFHKDAEFAAEAVEAAGAQGQYFRMAGLIQANQKQMTRDQYMHYAEFLHLDMAAFTRDLDEHRYRAKVQGDLAEGNALGVHATPTLLINGRTLTGSQTADLLSTTIRASLNEAAKGDATQVLSSSASLPPVDMTALVRDPTEWRGPADAPVTIVEFTDFECPFCRRASLPIALLLQQSGTPVRYVFRNFPLDFHAHAELAAEAALAARAQGKFWQMHDLLFSNQKNLSRQSLINLAEQLHLDVARFTNEIDAGKYKAEIAADRTLGVQADVNGTPAFFINGRRVDGALTLPELTQAVALAGSSRQGAQAIASTTESSLPHTSTVVAGRQKTPVTLTWFADIQTSSAARMGQLVRQLAGDSGADAKVRVVFKYYAAPGHVAAPFAHLALVEAAAEGRFWQLYDALTAVHFTSDTIADRAAIVSAAKAAQLDASRVEAAMSAGLDAADLRADTAEAEWRGIRGVPTLFVNQIRIDGLQSPSLYTDYIAKALAQTPSSGN